MEEEKYESGDTIEREGSECTYKKNDIFVVEKTGARVSVDGSVYFLGQIWNQMPHDCPEAKPIYVYTKESNGYKCVVKIVIKDKQIKSDSGDIPLLKNDSKALAWLNLISELHRRNLISDSLQFKTSLLEIANFDENLSNKSNDEWQT